jgi:protocatechuate 3,4-dioxygenase beta subunit
MERKAFLKLGVSALGMATILPMLTSCAKDTTTSANTGTEGACTVSPSETAGPFPTKDPKAFIITDIRSDRKGVDMTVNITIQNTKASCAALAGAMVDIWHCDAAGAYSEYGSVSALHFLRGRQTTNAKGMVSFLTKFPGWYNGRATHIHVHIFSASGASLLVTQIAFPEASDSAVVTVNKTAPYKVVSSGYTYNKSDGIFSDGTANQMSVITGSVAAGYILTQTIKV